MAFPGRVRLDIDRRDERNKPVIQEPGVYDTPAGTTQNPGYVNRRVVSPGGVSYSSNVYDPMADAQYQEAKAKAAAAKYTADKINEKIGKEKAAISSWQQQLQQLDTDFRKNPNRSVDENMAYWSKRDEIKRTLQKYYEDQIRGQQGMPQEAPQRQSGPTYSHSSGGQQPGGQEGPVVAAPNTEYVPYRNRDRLTELPGVSNPLPAVGEKTGSGNFVLDRKDYKTDFGDSVTKLYYGTEKEAMAEMNRLRESDGGYQTSRQYGMYPSRDGKFIVEVTDMNFESEGEQLYRGDDRGRAAFRTSQLGSKQRIERAVDEAEKDRQSKERQAGAKHPGNNTGNKVNLKANTSTYKDHFTSLQRLLDPGRTWDNIEEGIEFPARRPEELYDGIVSLADQANSIYQKMVADNNYTKPEDKAAAAYKALGYAYSNRIGAKEPVNLETITPDLMYAGRYYKKFSGASDQHFDNITQQEGLQFLIDRMVSNTEQSKDLFSKVPFKASPPENAPTQQTASGTDAPKHGETKTPAQGTPPVAETKPEKKSDKRFVSDFKTDVYDNIKADVSEAVDSYRKNSGVISETPESQSYRYTTPETRKGILGETVETPENPLTTARLFWEDKAVRPAFNAIGNVSPGFRKNTAEAELDDYAKNLGFGDEYSLMKQEGMSPADAMEQLIEKYSGGKITEQKSSRKQKVSDTRSDTRRKELEDFLIAKYPGMTKKQIIEDIFPQYEYQLHLNDYAENIRKNNPEKFNDLASMPIDALRRSAENYWIRLPSSATKADYINAISQAIEEERITDERNRFASRATGGPVSMDQPVLVGDQPQYAYGDSVYDVNRPQPLFTDSVMYNNGDWRGTNATYRAETAMPPASEFMAGPVIDTQKAAQIKTQQTQQGTQPQQQAATVQEVQAPVPDDWRERDLYAARQYWANRAEGGPVIEEVPYNVGEVRPEILVTDKGAEVVGENGPEVIVPESDGYVIPNTAIDRNTGSADMFAADQKIQSFEQLERLFEIGLDRIFGKGDKKKQGGVTGLRNAVIMLQ